MGNYVCQRAIHPGELLKDEVESRGLIQKSLAEQMGIPYTALNDILNSRRSLTATTAMLFEAANFIINLILVLTICDVGKGCLL